MPTARVNGITLYYEIHGQGPNLTLIEGLGYHRWMWYRQIPSFPRHFRTLIYDNRGVGRSDKPRGPYSHRQNAADLLGLLDHLGWDRTHLLGISMGGFIAQQFALDHPERLDRLVLVATGFGGKNMVPVPPEAVKALTPDKSVPLEERLRRAMPIAFGDPGWPERHREEFEQILRWRLEEPQPPKAAIAQAMAALTFDVEKRLRAVTAPTLIVTGSKDRVVPPQNAELLARAIPHARLQVIPDAGHLAFIEESEQFNQTVIDFLLAPEPPR